MNKFNPFQNFMAFMQRSFTTFDMSNFHQFSTSLGKLKVVRTDEVLPSDFWRGNTNVSVNLAPLLAPAYTRIKCVTQAFYVPYQSVWRFWNNFISDRPSNSYLNKANLASYKGVYSEPCISAQFIQILCKIYYGYYGVSHDPGEAVWRLIPTVTMFNKPVYTHTWSTVDGRRTVTRSRITPSVSMQDGYYGTSDESIYVGEEISNADIYLSAGYNDSYSFFYALLESCIECLKDFGIPTKLMAQSSSGYYDTFLINALPFMCYSKIWQDIFRNPIVQGTELDYSEVNGILSRPFYYNGNLHAYDYADLEGVSQDNWKIRMSDVPYGYADTNPFISINLGVNNSGADIRQSLYLCTGYNIQKLFEIGTNKLALLPSYYNGLLHQRSRNFETDLFTSAATDPLQGMSSVAVPSTINELRAASKLEEFLESNTAARNFRDFIRTHWGPTPQQDSDTKALFLGSSIVPVNISQTLQTSTSTDSVTPLGERAGVASAFGNGDIIRKNFTDHGMIITLMSFVIDSQYFQGLPYQLKHHKDYLDYPWPEFANLGLEAIHNYLLYFGDGNSVNFMDTVNNLLVKDGATLTRNTTTGSNVNTLEGVFGYTPRYSNYKFKFDQLSGQFQDKMSFWNTFREFSSLPKLSHNFLSYENAVFMSNLNRIFAITTDSIDKFYVDCYNDYSVSRALPLVSNPKLD